MLQKTPSATKCCYNEQGSDTYFEVDFLSNHKYIAFRQIDYYKTHEYTFEPGMIFFNDNAQSHDGASLLRTIDWDDN